MSIYICKLEAFLRSTLLFDDFETNHSGSFHEVHLCSIRLVLDMQGIKYLCFYQQNRKRYLVVKEIGSGVFCCVL